LLELNYKALGITHQSSLFKLSFEGQNLFSILLDTSSMNKGVFRLYSAHPMTRLVSIPIYNPQTNEFRKDYLNYKILREKASIVSVVEQFKKNDVNLFLLKPHKITRQQIRDLLKPDALFPSFAIILRFNSIHAVRTPYSFRFWRRFYELKIFYAFLRSIAFNFKKTERSKEVLDYIASLSRKLNIKNPKYLLILINQFFQNSINFEYYSQKLEMLYYIQFFGELKSDIFMKDNYEDLTLLFSDQFDFTYFLRQTESPFSIIIYTLGDIFSSDITNASTTKSRVLQDLNGQIGALIKSINTYKNNREDLLIKTIHLIIFLNFVVKRFVRDFYIKKGKS